jgi:hypothetical protein
MVKIRGKQRWEHYDDIYRELMACEIQLDSLHQKMSHDLRVLVFPEEKSLSYENYRKRLMQVGKALGHVRSAQQLIGHAQKTLKRWTNPAPNQQKKKL